MQQTEPPATVAILPVVDRPALQYIVEEAARAGLGEVLMVTGRNKSAIEDFFDRTPELEDALEKKGDAARMEAVRASTEVAQVHFVRQGEAKGLGHAVLQAASFVLLGSAASMLLLYRRRNSKAATGTPEGY